MGTATLARLGRVGSARPSAPFPVVIIRGSRTPELRVPVFRGSGPEPGPLLPEPRASRSGSFTGRSRSRTRGGGSYDSRVLCKSCSRGFPPSARSGSGGVSEPLRDLALRGREGQPIQEVTSGQLALRGHVGDLSDRDPAQVRDAREEVNGGRVLGGRTGNLRVRERPCLLGLAVRVPPVEASRLPHVAHRLLRHLAVRLPRPHGVEEVLAELRGSRDHLRHVPLGDHGGGGGAGEHEGGGGGHGRVRGQVLGRHGQYS